MAALVAFAAQAQDRVDAGWANLPIDPPGKTVGR